MNADIKAINYKNPTVARGSLPEVVVTRQNSQNNTSTPSVKVDPIVINLPLLDINK